MHKHTEIKRA